MKTLVLVSGGLDSSVLLARAVQMVGSENVVGLNIYYGQKHSIEMECARVQCEKYGIPLINADLSEAFKYDTSCPLLKDSKEAMPTQSYAEQLAEMGGQGTVKTYIPFRNGLFLSYATAIALQFGVKTILYGAHADDATGNAYPDCTPHFIETLGDAIFFGTGNVVRLEAPFKNMNKAQIVAMGLELGVDFSYTWSCYNGKKLPCGVCGTCRDRIAAFQANGKLDPLVERLVREVVKEEEEEESKCHICDKPISQCDRG